MGPRFSLLESMALYSNLRRDNTREHGNHYHHLLISVFELHLVHEMSFTDKMLFQILVCCLLNAKKKKIQKIQNFDSNKVGILRRPAFKSRHSEQSHHGHQDVIEVEFTVVPQSSVDGWLVHITILIQDERAPLRK